VQWKDLRVGDVIKVEKLEYFPADVLLVGSSEPKGICYIETKNLDGETNMKQKNAYKVTQDFFDIPSHVSGSTLPDVS
jgi:P-type E1-E2 ATPase